MGKDGILYNIKETEGIRDLGSERADTLRWISFGAQVASMQPPVHVESGRLSHAFEALDMDFRQSLAICPVRPQNIHSLLLKQCLCSAVVSLPSLPNFKEMSSFEELELVEVLAVFPEDSLESLEVLDLLLPEEVEAEGLLEDDLEGLEGFTCLLSSDLHFQ